MVFRSSNGPVLEAGSRGVQKVNLNYRICIMTNAPSRSRSRPPVRTRHSRASLSATSPLADTD